MIHQPGVVPGQVKYQCKPAAAGVLPQGPQNSAEGGTLAQGHSSLQPSPSDANVSEPDSWSDTSREGANVGSTAHNNLALNSLSPAPLNVARSSSVGVELDAILVTSDGYTALLAQSKVCIHRTSGKNNHWTLLSQNRLPMYTASYSSLGILLHLS